ncbi:hypothetical protein RchiOBHm_Chr2g0160451 [Rosa chinensis]|uniref:Uncharacterized protein n=1 Tax=Rosa chinensis TaxID=74649 RepID=A0A2P6S2K1_ROSCH|nr:hypothetical protein RchiOBHm_Chr2g0160451 [Rosa chinensis]
MTTLELQLPQNIQILNLVEVVVFNESLKLWVSKSFKSPNENIKRIGKMVEKERKESSPKSCVCVFGGAGKRNGIIGMGFVWLVVKGEEEKDEGLYVCVCVCGRRKRNGKIRMGFVWLAVKGEEEKDKGHVATCERKRTRKRKGK